MKTIEIDPLDSESIDKAIKELNKFAKKREQRIEEYVMRLAQEGQNAARRTYGSLVNVTAHKDSDKVWEIRADGEQVVFLEFGTGVKVQDHPELSNTLSIEIMPGSWSESPEGKHTWSTWLEGGYVGKGKTRWIQRRFDEYPYNTEPRPGMWEAYKAIVAAQDRIAHEVFDK